jgi:hypothetical protein
MNLQQTLTKENFFNEIMATYPKAANNFLNWIDDYKTAVNWDSLFQMRLVDVDIVPSTTVSSSQQVRQEFLTSVKFHEIPYAMQYGIWIEYCRQTLSNFFEQPEHISDTIDLAEDIKSVFAQIDSLIT